MEKVRLELEFLKKDKAASEKFEARYQEEDRLEKPYTNLKLINDQLTIVLNDGNIISKPGATQEDFKKAREASTEEELFKIAYSSEGLEEKRKEEAAIAKNKALIQGMEILKDHPDFEVKEDSVYLNGINRSLPQLLLEKFIEIIGKGEDVQSEEYLALKKFWLKCCLNPNAQSAEDLYTFLSYHQFKIDKHGNFYAYRRVVSKEHVHKELVEFISNAYNKIKGVWKKKPADYYVWRGDDGEYSFNKYRNPMELSISSLHDGINKLIGNLQELYLDLPNMQENSYTDAHTNTMDYRVGEASSIKRDEGNDDNSVSCSRGLHIASKQYNYSGFGDTPILAIINPVDVLAVPMNEVGKLRTCRWFFAMVLDEDEQYILDDDDFDVTELGDVFEEKCGENLQEYVQNSFAEEVKRHTFQIPSTSASEINKIILSLEEMKESISDRVVEFD